MLKWLLLHHFESPYAPILDFETEPLKQKEMQIKGIKEQEKRNQTLWRRYDFFWDITIRVMDVHQKIRIAKISHSFDHLFGCWT